MASKKSQNLNSTISRIGIWSEIIGFIYLAIATVTAKSLTQDSVSGQIFDIPLLAGLATFSIILYSSIAVGFIVCGYYLHSVRGKRTQSALVFVLILSILTILSIISAIPAILSIMALSQINKSNTSVKKVKHQRKKFDVRDYPALSAMTVLLLIIIFCIFTGLKDTTKSTNAFDFKYEKVPCQSESSGCVVIVDKDAFKATFPASPTISTMKNSKGGNPTNGTDGNKTLYERTYKYAPDTTSHDYENYIVSVVDYGSELANDRNIQDYQLTRLQNGVGSPFILCDVSGDESIWDLGVQTTYQQYPALSLELRNGRSYSEKPCSIESMTFLKQTKTYTIMYVSYPSAADATKFNSFLSSFSLL